MTDIDRFWRHVKIDPASKCWNWTASVNFDGYPQSIVGSRTDNTRRTVRLSRFFYEYYKKKIAKGMEIDHLCRNRRCVNPDHLEAVTHQENVNRADKSLMGLHNKNKTHCRNGHAYDDDNTYYTKQGHRQCRICKAAAVRKHKANHK